MEELGLLALKGVSDELQNPAHDEERYGIRPERVKEDAGEAEAQREHDQRDADAVANTVDRMSMAACVLRDPLFARASAHHHGRIIADRAKFIEE